VIEKARISGELGSSLEAEVELYVKEESQLYKILSALKNELRFILITSDVILLTSNPPQQALLFKINTEELAVNVISTVGKKTKCARCWHRRSDVGKDLKHPEICLRCVENLPNGKGEQRVYA
jgi:isoleucyl-tRNA synthetase